MEQIVATTTVGRLVAEQPARSRVFERMGIDYCCGGKVTLEKAVSRKELDLRDVLDALAACDAEEGAEDQAGWSHATVSELVDHIVKVHHGYLNEELPQLSYLVNKVCRVHGGDHPELREVHNSFEDLKADLFAHMAKEEHILFSLCLGLETAGVAPRSHCGTVENPIRVMELEHQDAGHALERLRELTNGYAPPEGACNSYRAMLARLEALEGDMHHHVHKENNILFPRVAALEKELAPA